MLKKLLALIITILNWLWHHKFSLVLIPLGIYVISWIAFWALNPHLSPSWTGFGEYQKPNGEIEPAKSLWDWMNLLIVPVVIAFGALLLNRAEKNTELALSERRAKSEREIAQERIREDALQSYLDRMTELLLKEELRKSRNKDEVRSIARARTLAVFRGLDGVRKGLILQFLYETGLILNIPIIELVGANLSDVKLRRADLTQVRLDYTNLRQADLTSARLIGANLFGARVIQASLINADLTSTNLHLANLEQSNMEFSTLADSDLSDANLTKANLNSVYLVRANLRSANLTGASLRDADLREADLTRAVLNHADLRGAKLNSSILRGTKLKNANLEGAILDDSDMSLSDMSGARISQLQLAKVKSLEVATMKDGKIYKGESYA